MPWAERRAAWTALHEVETLDGVVAEVVRASQRPLVEKLRCAPEAWRSTALASCVRGGALAVDDAFAAEFASRAAGLQCVTRLAWTLTVPNVDADSVAWDLFSIVTVCSFMGGMVRLHC